MSDTKLNVFDIQRGSFHDGPGIRTVVFVKGCNMTCFWCQNPESQKSKPQLMVYSDRCIGCGKCLTVCQNHCHKIVDGERIFDKNACVACGICAENCNTETLQISGKSMTEDEVMEIVLKDMEMYRLSGGGITISGGEPLLQHTACTSLRKKTKEKGIHTAIETCGNAPWKCFEEMLPYLDLVYMDIKDLDEERHIKNCGTTNKTVLRNFEKLAGTKTSLIIRTPIIPGVNDNEKFIHAMGKLISKNNVKRYELLPFHKLGAGKYHALGMLYKAENLKTPSAELMKTFRNIIKSYGIETNG